jgi:hypothetical protein
MKYSYDYFDKLGDPDDDEFISKFKEDLKLLYGKNDTAINDIKDINSLMEYIKGKLQVDLEEIIIITWLQREIHPELGRNQYNGFGKIWNLGTWVHLMVKTI